MFEVVQIMIDSKRQSTLAIKNDEKNNLSIFRKF